MTSLNMIVENLLLLLLFICFCI